MHINFQCNHFMFAFDFFSFRCISVNFHICYVIVYLCVHFTGSRNHISILGTEIVFTLFDGEVE